MIQKSVVWNGVHCDVEGHASPGDETDQVVRNKGL